jgi:hypothetical protein
VSSIAEDLHQAVAGVLQAHGYGMVSRLAFVVELVDEETGGLGLMRGTTPNDLPVWSELGLLQYAVMDIQATITA